MPFSVQHFMVLMNFEVLFWALKNTFGQLICSFFGAEFDCYLFGRFCRGFFDSEWFFELRFEVFKLLVANLSVFGVENENITCNPLSDLLDFRYISLPSPIRTFSCKKSPKSKSSLNLFLHLRPEIHIRKRKEKFSCFLYFDKIPARNLCFPSYSRF